MHTSLAARRTSMVQRRPSPLVRLDDHKRDAQGSPDSLVPTPLPFFRMLPLLIARISEGMTFTVIFPYINEAIASFGVNEKDIGFYAGVIVCLVIG